MSIKYSKTLGTPIIAAAVAMITLSAFATIFIIKMENLPSDQLFSIVWPLILASSVAVILVMSILYESLTEMVELIEKQRMDAREAALHDPLTGSANRRLLMNRLEHALRQKARGQIDVALLVIDLDKFKSVNDAFGHDIGDQLINEAALRLRQRLRDVDTLARIGGDEFAILLSPVSGNEGVDKVCRDILFDLADIFTLSGKEINLGASIGAALASDDESASELMCKADIAMYAAKKAGRNRHKFYTPETDKVIARKDDIATKLQQALVSGQGLDVHFQPILGKDNAIIGLEGFLRWTDPKLGVISPGEVIPIAEECGLIDKVGRYVIEQCCDVANNIPDLTISMNLSALQFRDGAMGSLIEDQVKQHGLCCSRFELEITEKLLIEQPPEFADNLQHLRNAGFRIALDDFGTGYSSLNCLNEYIIDTVKLDSSFTKNAQQSQSIALLRSAVSLGHANGLRVLAEGVASIEQRDIALASGCDGMQGHLIARPMPRGELFEFFRSHSNAGDQAA